MHVRICPLCFDTKLSATHHWWKEDPTSLVALFFHFLLLLLAPKIMYLAKSTLRKPRAHWGTNLKTIYKSNRNRLCIFWCACISWTLCSSAAACLATNSSSNILKTEVVMDKAIKPNQTSFFKFFDPFFLIFDIVTWRLHIKPNSLQLIKNSVPLCFRPQKYRISNMSVQRPGVCV